MFEGPSSVNPVSSTTLMTPSLSPPSLTSEGHEGWLEGASFRGLISDVFEDMDTHTLALTDLFGDEMEQIISNRAKRNKL